MDLRQLRYFATVAHAGSFMAASRLLHISQPALGYKVRQLEDSVGVSLLKRHSRGVRPTEAGRVLLRRADAILASVRQAEAELAPFRCALVGEFTLGVTPTSGRTLVPDLLEACADRPGLTLVVRRGLSNELFAAVATATIDLALCYDPPPSAEVTSVALSIAPFGLFGDEIAAGRPSQRRHADPPLMRTLHLIFRPGLADAVSGFVLEALRTIVRQRILDGHLGWQEVPEAVVRA